MCMCVQVSVCVGAARVSKIIPTSLWFQSDLYNTKVYSTFLGLNFHVYIHTLNALRIGF